MGNRKVIIVGGGASGMIAAIAASRKGANVVILERNPRVGKKILVTGNGRCNFTNIYLDAKNYHGNNSKFVYSAISKFSVEDTINFFERLGIAHVVEDGGKVFPMSFQASSILDVLRFELEDLGVEVVCDAFVRKIKKENDEFIITLEDGKNYRGDRVILSTGGKAMPSTGSDGNGYELSKQLGHSITDVFPGLVQIKLEENFLKQIDGVKIVGTARLLHKGKVLKEDKGDILFANYGISGPPILQLSRNGMELLNKGEVPVLSVSIINDLSREEVSEYLKKRFSFMTNKTVETCLIGLVNKRLIPVLLKESGINDMRKNVANLNSKEIESLANILTDWRFKITGSKSWSSAQVTAGGVDTREIESNTLESKLVKGLFFAGELIDIDGDCGGFNLQWAWSSGYIAGEMAAIG